MNRHLFQVEGEDRLYLLERPGRTRRLFPFALRHAHFAQHRPARHRHLDVHRPSSAGSPAYFGGVFDNTAMRLTEVLVAIPGLYLLLALRGAFAELHADQMFFLIVFILSFIGWSGTARIIRGMTLSLRNRQFVLAAEVMGQSSWMILWKHVLPNVFSYLIVAPSAFPVTYSARLRSASLVWGSGSFRLLGIDAVAGAESPGLHGGYWWFLMPGLAIFITVISFNVLGDVLRDIVDPRQKFLRG